MFLNYRIEPDNKYYCECCDSVVYGIPLKGYLSAAIICEICNNQLEVNKDKLRFYFGWYKGWCIEDFNTQQDIEYLRWVLENLESILTNYRLGIQDKIS